MRSIFAAVALAGLSAGAVSLAHASDHRDGPGTLTDQTVDLTDLYAWMSPDAAKVNLVMNLQGSNTGATTGTKLSSSALYVFHVGSAQRYGAAATEDQIVCQFDSAAQQGFSCWGPSTSYVQGTVGDKAGFRSADGHVHAAVLLRDDPFWWNLRGFLVAAYGVYMSLSSLSLDPAGCPSGGTWASTLIQALGSDGSGGPGVDDFGAGGKAPVACTAGKCDATATTNGNVLSIVLSVDKGSLVTGGPILSVWGSTNQVGF